MTQQELRDFINKNINTNSSNSITGANLNTALAGLMNILPPAAVINNDDAPANYTDAVTGNVLQIPANSIGTVQNGVFVPFDVMAAIKDITLPAGTLTEAPVIYQEGAEAQNPAVPGAVNYDGLHFFGTDKNAANHQFAWADELQMSIAAQLAAGKIHKELILQLANLLNQVVAAALTYSAQNDLSPYWWLPTNIYFYKKSPDSGGALTQSFWFILNNTAAKSLFIEESKYPATHSISPAVLENLPAGYTVVLSWTYSGTTFTIPLFAGSSPDDIFPIIDGSDIQVQLAVQTNFSPMPSGTNVQATLKLLNYIAGTPTIYIYLASQYKVKAYAADAENKTQALTQDSNDLSVNVYAVLKPLNIPFMMVGVLQEVTDGGITYYTGYLMPMSNYQIQQQGVLLMQLNGLWIEQDGAVYALAFAACALMFNNWNALTLTAAQTITFKLYPAGTTAGGRSITLPVTPSQAAVPLPPDAQNSDIYLDDSFDLSGYTGNNYLVVGCSLDHSISAQIALNAASANRFLGRAMNMTEIMGFYEQQMTGTLNTATQVSAVINNTQISADVVVTPQYGNPLFFGKKDTAAKTMALFEGSDYANVLLRLWDFGDATSITWTVTGTPTGGGSAAVIATGTILASDYAQGFQYQNVVSIGLTPLQNILTSYSNIAITIN